MTARLPLVRMAGETHQLPAGDWLGGMPTQRIYLQGAVLRRIGLDINGELPVQLADGTASAVTVIGAVHGR